MAYENHTVCPLSKAEFAAQAERLSARVGELQIDAEPKVFGTGSFGWFANGKANVRVGEELVRCQYNLTVTVIGSKQAQ